jgi:transposase
MTLVDTTEVLEPGARTLRELADEANHEHELVIEAGASMVEHAIRAGEALIRARQQCGYGEWRPWIDENLKIRYAQVSTYMRLARYQEAVRASGMETIRAARDYLMGFDGDSRCGLTNMPAWLRDEAQKLHSDGASRDDIAAQLGISRTTAYRWTDPTFLARHREKIRQAAARRREVERLASEQEREREIKRAVRRAGAATREAYAMAERMQDVLAQAQRETEDREARRALSEAGVHYRKMRDEIVRALGVT